jgi:demethylmenaquinone methyltransferase/2-methoxy-6-polyprenyl-1,4-benzoquinol methylase
MSDVARKKIIHAGLADLIDFQQGDAAALPFRADSFDALFLSFTLELFDTPEMPAVLAECRRVLKPNGRICVVALARDSRANMSLRIYEWFHQYLPAYADCRPIDVPSTLQQAGFKIQDVTRKGMWGLPVEICLAQKEDAQ